MCVGFTFDGAPSGQTVVRPEHNGDVDKLYDVYTANFVLRRGG